MTSSASAVPVPQGVPNPRRTEGCEKYGHHDEPPEDASCQEQ